MAGIRDSRGVLHSVVWVDPEEVPTLFLVVKDGATALAHPDYVSETLYSVNQGDLDLRDAWDHLLIKTPDMGYPKPCEVVASTLDSALIMVDGVSLYRISH